LLNSGLSDHVDFLLLDSTQASNPPPGLLVRGALAVRRFVKFCMRLYRERPDATLIFMSAGASVVEKGLMAWWSRAFGVPVLLFPRAGSVIDYAAKSFVVRWTLRVLFHPANVLLCQSRMWQEFARSTLRFPESRAIVVENWTATPPLLAIGSARHHDDSSSRQLRITYVGWLEKEKGVLELLESCRILSHDHEFVLQLVGDGSFAEAAKSFVAQSRMEANVAFLGWLEPAELHGILKESDIFVLPSWAEGLPNAMIEAMAAGLPVVVTGVGGIPDVIENGVSGLVVRPRSSSELQIALGRMMDDADLRRSLASAAYEIARNRFSTDIATEKLRRAFKLALGRGESD
jgi:glycosyltransferase involved in cell wall biosynthesis